MHRCLAVVDDDGNGVMGDDDYDDFNDATDFTVVLMALLRSLRWHCCPGRNGIIAFADAQASCH